MKLLLDENISFRLLGDLETIFPGSAHVGQLGMGGALDAEVWEYAKTNHFVLVTFDADFHELTLIRGGPPTVLWLRCGNQARSAIRDRLLHHGQTIIETASDPDVWCLEIY